MARRVDAAVYGGILLGGELDADEVDGPLDHVATNNGGLDRSLFAVERRQHELAPGLGRHISELEEGQTGPADVTRPPDVILYSRFDGVLDPNLRPEIIPRSDSSFATADGPGAGGTVSMPFEYLDRLMHVKRVL